MRICSKIFLASIAIGFAAITPAKAIDVAPGGYTSLPDDTNIALLYYQFSNSNTLANTKSGNVPSSNLSLALGIARYLHYFEVDGVRFAIDTFLPIGNLNSRIAGTAQPIRDGVGDLSVGGLLWLAYSADPRGTTAAISTYVTVPTGSFSPFAVSLGSGMYSVSPQLSIIQGLGQGWFFENTIDVAVQSDYVGNATRLHRGGFSQFQSYLRYNLTETATVSIGYSGIYGGKLIVNGVYSGQTARKDEARIVFSKFFDTTFQAQFLLGADFAAPGGFRRDPYVQVRLLKIF